ncbi:MalY/PatB family protein [Paenibacillus taiwanensis]|uniref:MalY/PatB family protein n=1 Tax=Paenibacillus taiwanensis TaxID=401638 RepID=UPI0003FFA9B5|nr:PatB family C-S lyase [Paenibacillus taiwanensis]
MYNFDGMMDRRRLNAIKATPQHTLQLDCIPLWIADMDFPAAKEIHNALMQRMNIPNYGYTLCTDSYYEAVTGWMQRRHAWDVKHDWVLTTPGVIPAMAFAVRSIVKPGEKVMIQPPVYPQFARMIQLNGAELVTNPLKLVNGRYEIDFEDFALKAQDPALKLCFLCNPHNPVGRVWSRDDLKRLADICLENDVIIFSDDIHHDFVYGPNPYIPIASLSEEVSQITITATAPSKTFSLASFKMGNIIIQNEALRKAYNVAINSVGCTSLDVGAIEATIAGYTYGEQWLQAVIQYLEQNNALIDSYIAAKMPMVKTVALEGTYLKWLDFRALGMNNSELESWSLTQAKVWLSEGYTFGVEGSGFKRLNMASSRSVIQEALERMERAIHALS